MAATVITRPTITNDTGTAASPNADGTLINSAWVNSAIYDKIDQMFGGGAGYATFTFGGAIATEASGTAATFSGAATGGSGQVIFLRNTSAGTGNFTQFAVGNDASTTALTLRMNSTTFTTSNQLVQDGALLQCERAGGISIAAIHASGDIRFYTGGTTLKAKLHASGALELVSQASHPTSLAADTNWQIYVKDDKLVLQWNEGGTRYYYYLTGGQSGGTWTQTTSAP